MMKQYKKELIVSTLLALLPIAAGLLLWNRLPGQLATHWGMQRRGQMERQVRRRISPAPFAAGRPLSGAVFRFSGR